MRSIWTLPKAELFSRWRETVHYILYSSIVRQQYFCFKNKQGGVNSIMWLILLHENKLMIPIWRLSRLATVIITLRLFTARRFLLTYCYHRRSQELRVLDPCDTNNMVDNTLSLPKLYRLLNKINRYKEVR